MRSKIQLEYIKRVMSICAPFEERYVHYPPSSFANSSFDRDDDEPEEEILVHLKPNEAFPVIVINKDKDQVEVRLLNKYNLIHNFYENYPEIYNSTYEIVNHR